MAEGGDGACTINLARLDQFRRNPLEASQKNDHGIAGELPDVDQYDCPQRLTWTSQIVLV